MINVKREKKECMKYHGIDELSSQMKLILLILLTVTNSTN